MTSGQPSSVPVSKRSRRRQSNPPAVLGTQEASQVQVVAQQNFSGPIPPPEYLAAYDQIQTGLAERIVKMAEVEGDHRRALEARNLEGEIEDRKWERRLEGKGQAFAFMIAVSGFVTSAFCAYFGAAIAAAAIGGGSLVTIVVAFLTGRAKLKKTDATSSAVTQQDG